MSEVPTQSDILAASSERGLLAYLFEVAGTHAFYRESEFLAVVPHMVNSQERTLFADRDRGFLNAMNGPPFFRGMVLLCELIPLLDVGHRDMMQFVASLVRLGGRDGAATRPNAAFRTWCSGDSARSKAVLDDARKGDSLATNHLCFALEAGADSSEAFSEALMFLNEGPSPEAQIHAATALRRMTLDPECAVAAVRSLTEVSITTDDNLSLRSNALLSIFAILGQNAELSREGGKRVLDKVLLDTSTETFDALSGLIWQYGGSLSKDEVRSILRALQSVDPDHRGTLERIDAAALGLTGTGHFNELSNLVAELIRKSQGKLGLNDFPSFCHKLVDQNSRRLGRTAVNWFLDGDPYLCSSLAKQIRSIGGQSLSLALQPDDIPLGPEDQLFVCRKAAGFLFHTPVTAASVLVAVLRHGHDCIAEKIGALLFDPLLISFGGELRRYLEGIVERNSEPNITRIKEILTWKQQHLDGFDGIETLVELHPSDSQRQIERVHSNQKISQAMEESMKHSVIHHLATTQYLLYGETSCFYSEGLDGELHQVSMDMQPHSASVEYPHLAIFDPEGLRMTLHRLKYEQSVNP